jgi:septal ring factor EnvC (AmiA/AmiB activator)
MRNPFKRSKRPEDAPGAGPGPEPAAATPTPVSPAPDAAQAPPTADPQARIDGLRAWLAQVERKVGVRSYAGGAAIVLALAAGIVGVVLALSAKDESATKDDLSSLRNQVEQVSQEASAAAEEQVGSLAARVDALEQQVSGLANDKTTIERELEVAQDDIDDLRNQISDLESAGPGAGGGQGN